LSSRGMIKIKIPATRATMAGTCAAVIVIEKAPAGFVSGILRSNRGPQSSC